MVPHELGASESNSPKRAVMLTVLLTACEVGRAAVCLRTLSQRSKGADAWHQSLFRSTRKGREVRDQAFEFTDCLAQHCRHVGPGRTPGPMLICSAGSMDELVQGANDTVESLTFGNDG